MIYANLAELIFIIHRHTFSMLNKCVLKRVSRTILIEGKSIRLF